VSRLSEEDARELARLIREARTNRAARHERERLAAGQGPCQCEPCQWVRAAYQGIPITPGSTTT
jgi:hypothetical protein